MKRESAWRSPSCYCRATRRINSATPVRLNAMATAEVKINQRLGAGARCTVTPMLRVRAAMSSLSAN
jgi:hypothetical protein